MKSRATHKGKAKGASAIKNPMAANNRGKTSSRPEGTGHKIQKSAAGTNLHTLGRV